MRDVISEIELRDQEEFDAIGIGHDMARYYAAPSLSAKPRSAHRWWSEHPLRRPRGGR